MIFLYMAQLIERCDSARIQDRYVEKYEVVVIIVLYGLLFAKTNLGFSAKGDICGSGE